MRKFSPNQKPGVNLKSLRDPSNKKVQELINLLKGTNKVIARILENESDDFIVTCGMVDDFCLTIYDPVILATIKDIRESIFSFLITIGKDTKTLKNLPYEDGFNFYFASLLVTYLVKIGENSLNKHEAKRILLVTQEIEWNPKILSIFLFSISPGELDDEILNIIINKKSKYLSNKNVLRLIFEKIGYKNIKRKHIEQIFGVLSDDLLPELDGVIRYFGLLEMV